MAPVIKLDDLISSFKSEKMNPSPSSPKSMSSSNDAPVSRIKASHVLIIILLIILALFIIRDLRFYLNKNQCPPVWGLFSDNLSGESNDADKNKDKVIPDDITKGGKRQKKRIPVKNQPEQPEDDFDILEIDDEYFTPI